MLTPFGHEKDEFFMHKALEQARRAFAQDEVPVGAVVVDAQGNIVGRGYNQTEKRSTQIAHAECIAIARAGKKIGDWRLIGCWIYVTLEPCSMCMHLIRLSRCAGVVYGPSSPKFGYQLDNRHSFQIYKENVVEIATGVQAQKSADLLKLFFKNKRKK